MKQQHLHKLVQAFKTGLPVGAMLSLFVYGFARILFYEFTFTAWEEIVNFLKIVTAGGLLVSMAIVAFLILEMALQFVMTLKISLPEINFRNAGGNRSVIDFPMPEVSAQS